MPKPQSGETRKDFVARCMGDAEAVRDFPDREQRFAFCSSVYKRAHQVAARFAFSTAALQSGAAARTEQLKGHEYLVFPAVLVQGQILRNNLGVTYLPPDEITDAWAAMWNGVPVILHEHPTQRGEPVSARSPAILNDRGVGYVFHAHVVRNGAIKLKAEVWLEVARAAQLEELAEIFERLKAGKPVELSTGFSAAVDEEVGEVGGESYEKVMHPLDADHLAIFAEATGACSIDDGCGLGVNAAAFEIQSLIFPKEHWDSVADCKVWAGDHDFHSNKVDETEGSWRLRQRDPGDFARIRTICVAPGRDTPMEKCRVKAVGGPLKAANRVQEEEPIVEPSDNEQRGRVLGIVDRVLSLLPGGSGMAAPATNKCGAGDAPPAPAPAGNIIVHPLLKRLVGFGLTPCQAVEAVGLVRAANADYAESDDELRGKLYAALQMAYGGGKDRNVWVEAVYSANTQVVFCVVHDSLTGRMEQYYSATYTMAADGAITFSDPVKVQRRVVYEPVANAEAEGALMTQDAGKQDDGKEKAAPAAPAVVVAANADPVVLGAEGAGAPAAAIPLPADVVALQALVKQQGEQIVALQQVVAPAVEERERERQALVKQLTANTAVPFSAAELEAKPVDELRKLATMAGGESYIGRGGPRAAAVNAGEPEFMEPVAYFAENAKGTKDPQKKEGE